MPGDILTSMLTTAQKLTLLDEQIDIIQRKAEWLKLHRFLLVLRIEKHCAEPLEQELTPAA